MHKILFIFLSIFTVTHINGQTIPEEIRFYGKVVENSGKPLIHAHVIDLSEEIGTLTNYDGEFLIHVYPEDTLRFSSVGYKTKLLIIPHTEENYYRKIILEKDTVALSETIIYPYPSSLDALRKEFLTVEIEDTEPKFDLHLEMANIEPKPHTQTGIVISGPISALYNQFSRHAKIQRKYYELINHDVLKKRASKIYSVAMVKKVTGFKSVEEVVNFMEFCDLEPEFVLNHTEYELILAINNCLIQYVNSPK